MNPAGVTLIMDMANKLSIEMTELAITILENSLKNKRHQENMRRINNGESLHSIFGYTGDDRKEADRSDDEIRAIDDIVEAEQEKELLNDQSND